MKALHIISLVLIFAFPAFGEDISITADKQVEWHQHENRMVALGNAVAAKGNMQIHADRLSADYMKNTSGKTEISKIHASGKVVLSSGDTQALGSELNYNIKQDAAVLKGFPAQIKTPTETISAVKSITYYPSLQKAVALGDVEGIDKNGNKLFSDVMTAYFEKDATGKLQMTRAESSGNVKIVTKDAVVTAAKGLYLPADGKIKLFENVTIQHEDNILKGDEAETDLNTGISRLLSQKKNGRVSGIFKEKKKEKNNAGK